jgi:hypothetical protein
MIGDLFIHYHCGRNDIGYKLPEGVYEQMVSDLAVLGYGYNVFKEQTYGPLRKLLLDEIEAQYAGESKVRFTLLSGHDLTLIAVLSAIGYYNDTMSPPCGSQLAVELWYVNRPMLRFVLNGEVIKVQGKEMIPLSTFKRDF